ncbi:MAG: hypothetical protein RSD07_01325 [Angelakisella sp.]
MGNQYQMLKQENQIRAKCMSPESQEAYAEAVRYFKKSNRHPYDTQWMYKELIGMGLAADTRGESLAETLGENPKEFYESLVENARPNTFWSMLSLWILPLVFGYYTFFQLLIWFAWPVLSPVRFTLFNLTCVIFDGIIIFLLAVLEKHRNIRTTKQIQVLYLVVFGGTMYLKIQLMKIIPPVVLFALPAWVWASIWAVLWYLSCRYRDWCYAKLAQERPWQG